MLTSRPFPLSTERHSAVRESLPLESLAATGAGGGGEGGGGRYLIRRCSGPRSPDSARWPCSPFRRNSSTFYHSPQRAWALSRGRRIERRIGIQQESLTRTRTRIWSPGANDMGRRSPGASLVLHMSEEQQLLEKMILVVPKLTEFSRHSSGGRQALMRVWPSFKSPGTKLSLLCVNSTNAPNRNKAKDANGPTEERGQFEGTTAVGAGNALGHCTVIWVWWYAPKAVQGGD